MTVICFNLTDAVIGTVLTWVRLTSVDFQGTALAHPTA